MAEREVSLSTIKLISKKREGLTYIDRILPPELPDMFEHIVRRARSNSNPLSFSMAPQAY